MNRIIISWRFIAHNNTRRDASMNEKNYKQRHMYKPIEKHITAPLTNVDEKLPMSKVNDPSDEAVEYAKLWVDINEK